MNEELLAAAEKILDSDDPLATLKALFPINSEQYNFLIDTIVSDKIQSSNTIASSFELFLGEWAAKLPEKHRKESSELLRKQVLDVNHLLLQATDEVGLERPKYGLIVGRIQSGKTSHITGLISSLLDQNFKSICPDLIIVLSGLAEDLRLQTTRRIQSIFGSEYVFPGLGRDLSKTIHRYETDDGSSESIKEQFVNGKRIFIIKKNCDVIQELLDELPNTLDASVLIIDDEADHASIDNNRKRNKKINYNKNIDPSLTNKLLRKLISAFSNNHVWYIGYTASPFANLLIQPFFSKKLDPLGLTLFPRDLLYSLNPPSSYTGIEAYFDGGERVKKVLPEVELDEKQILDFILRHLLTLKLRQFRSKDNVRIHTSMIHTSLSTDEHLEIAYLMLRTLKDTVLENSEFSRMKSKIKTLLKEYSHVPEYDEVSNYYRQLEYDDFTEEVETIEIIEMNRRKLDQDDAESGILRDLNYNLDFCNYLVIGGSRLSRGLTLEYLTNTWFTRTAQTPNYDTMMQMARWCGYREDYIDLTRIDTTEDIIQYFRNILEVEEQVRTKIHLDFLSGKKPLETIHWIRKHDGMNICRGDAIVDPWVRISGGIPTSTLWSYDVPYSSPTSPSNSSRDEVFRTFIEMMKDIQFGQNSEIGSESFDILRDIESSHVIGFLSKFVDSYDEDDWRHTPAHLRLFVDILKHEKWDIGLHSPKSDLKRNPEFEFDSVKLNMVQRASEERRFSIINSGSDNQFHNVNPMIMFYVINPDSTDVNDNRNFDVDSKMPAILFGIFLSSDDVDTTSYLEIAGGRGKND
jgi:hypothetical protein